MRSGPANVLGGRDVHMHGMGSHRITEMWVYGARSWGLPSLTPQGVGREGQLCSGSHSEARQSLEEPNWHPGLRGSRVAASSVPGREGSSLNLGAAPCSNARLPGRLESGLGAKLSGLRAETKGPLLRSRAAGHWGPSPLPGATLPGCGKHAPPPRYDERGHIPSSRGPHWLAQGRRVNMLVGIWGAPIGTGVHEAQCGRVLTQAMMGASEAQ